MLAKRIVVMTTLGFIAGLISWAIYPGLSGPGAAAVILSRAMLGFFLGLSAWAVNWALRGSVLGTLFSIPGGFAAMAGGWGAGGFWVWLLNGLIVGFLIELIAKPIFHARYVLPEPDPWTPV